MCEDDENNEPVDVPKNVLEDFPVEHLSDGFRVQTARQMFIIRPKESSAENWVGQIVEVMFGDPDDVDEEEERDYSDFLEGYNEVTSDKPEDA